MYWRICMPLLADCAAFISVGLTFYKWVTLKVCQSSPYGVEIYSLAYQAYKYWKPPTNSSFTQLINVVAKHVASHIEIYNNDSGDRQSESSSHETTKITLFETTRQRMAELMRIKTSSRSSQFHDVYHCQTMGNFVRTAWKKKNKNDRASA